MKAWIRSSLVLSSVILLASSANAETRGNLVFGGADLTEDSSSVFLGGVKAINGDLNRSGVVVRGLVSSGKYDYNTTAVPGGKVEGDLLQLEAEVGYQWVAAHAQASVYAGIASQDHDLTPDDLGNRSRGEETGGVIQFEAAKRTTPVDANIIVKLSDVNDSHWARGRLGYQVGKAKVGVELVDAGSNSYDETRYGLYTTFPVSDRTNLNLAAGHSNSKGKNSIADSEGAYATLGFGVSF